MVRKLPEDLLQRVKELFHSALPDIEARLVKIVNNAPAQAIMVALHEAAYPAVRRAFLAPPSSNFSLCISWHDLDAQCNQILDRIPLKCICIARVQQNCWNRHFLLLLCQSAATIKLPRLAGSNMLKVFQPTHKCAPRNVCILCEGSTPPLGVPSQALWEQWLSNGGCGVAIFGSISIWTINIVFCLCG